MLRELLLSNMEEKKIEVRESNISGKGVFAKKDIKRGERICFMNGEDVGVEECVLGLMKV